MLGPHPSSDRNLYVVRSDGKNKLRSQIIEFKHHPTFGGSLYLLQCSDWECRPFTNFMRILDWNMELVIRYMGLKMGFSMLSQGSFWPVGNQWHKLFFQKSVEGHFLNYYLVNMKGDKLKDFLQQVLHHWPDSRPHSHQAQLVDLGVGRTIPLLSYWNHSQSSLPHPEEFRRNS